MLLSMSSSSPHPSPECPNMCRISISIYCTEHQPYSGKYITTLKYKYNTHIKPKTDTLIEVMVILKHPINCFFFFIINCILLEDMAYYAGQVLAWTFDRGYHAVFAHLRAFLVFSSNFSNFSSSFFYIK